MSFDRKSVIKEALSAANRMVEGAGNAIGSTIALPKTLSAKLTEMRSGSDAKVLKDVRKYEGAPAFKDGQITDAGKLRRVADMVRAKRGAKEPMKEAAKSAVQRKLK